MSFVSLYFLIFIGLTTVIYFVFPLKYRWVVLLAASYLFFTYNSGYLLVIHVLTTIITFYIANILDKNNERFDSEQKKAEKLPKAERDDIKKRHKKSRRRICGVGVVLNLSALLLLKYLNFFASVFAGEDFTPIKLLLPIGISFYTLQAISYLVDTSKGKIKAEKNIFKFMLYMSYFPQIVQGPIARYKQLAHQLYEGHSFDYDRLCMGCQLIIWGFFKKLVIADRIGIPVNMIFNSPYSYRGSMIFLAAAGYGVQVYADFSGGMDVARGFSQIIGVDLALNFKQPYFSQSIEEFWRRWHITLGQWMKDYVFYPLSLSALFTAAGRRARGIFGDTIGKKIPPFIAMFLVYFLVGFWHGPEWKFVVYGIWNGVFIASGILLEDYYEKALGVFGIDPASGSYKLFRMVRTFVLCSIGRIFSRALDLKAAIIMIKAMCMSFLDYSYIVSGELKELGLGNGSWIVLALAVLLLFYTDSLHERSVNIRQSIAAQPLLLRWLFYITAIVSVMIFGVYGPGYNAANFIYQQF